MSVTELFPAIHALQHADKFRLMEFLLHELAQEEGVSLNQPLANNAEAIDALQILSRIRVIYHSSISITLAIGLSFIANRAYPGLSFMLTTP